MVTIDSRDTCKTKLILRDTSESIKQGKVAKE